MAERKRKKPRPVHGDPTDPQGMAVMIATFLEHLAVKGYTERTVRTAEEILNLFLLWLEERDVKRPSDVTRPVLLRYQSHLFHKRKPDGHPLTFSTQMRTLVVLKSFFRYLTKNNHLLYNPASEIDLPKVEKRLPQSVLTLSEVESILNEPDVATPLGLRDRAMLETFYSTGIRRAELARLRVFDVDPPRSVVRVRQGKGRKDRFVPIGERALVWIEKYLSDARPRLVVEPDDAALFLTRDGHGFRPDPLSVLVSSYIEAAGVKKPGSCHLFRHTMATMMLENGADIRFIQEMLGHAWLGSTQIYTQVSIAKLKEIHAATHPGAKLKPAKASGADEPLSSLAAEERHEDDERDAE